MFVVNGILSLLIISLIVNIAVILRTIIRTRKSTINQVKLNPGKKLVFILKVYEEHTTISDTIEHLETILQDNSNVFVYIVGTAKERDNNGLNKTLELAKGLTQLNPQYQVLECPLLHGSHAHQNNHVLNAITIDVESTWVYTLDIDTRISQNLLDEIFKSINAGKKISQAHSLFLSNFRKISLAEKSHALYQSRWTIAHEMKRLMLHNLLRMSIAHVVGHGLCINLKVLKEVGGFPENSVTEDIHLGFFLVALGEKIYSVDVFENGDNPVSLRDGLRQEYVWSYGAMMYPYYLRNFKERFHKAYETNKLRLFLITAHGVTTYIIWLITSWAFIACIILAIQCNYFALIFLLMYFLDFLLCSIFFFLEKHISLSDVLLSPVYFFLAVIRRSWGPNLAFGHSITGKKVIKYKTPHI